MQEKPAKVSPDQALWMQQKPAPAAGEAAKPELQAIGVRDFWQKQGSLEADPAVERSMLSGERCMSYLLANFTVLWRS